MTLRGRIAKLETSVALTRRDQCTACGSVDGMTALRHIVVEFHADGQLRTRDPGHYDAAGRCPECGAEPLTLVVGARKSEVLQ